MLVFDISLVEDWHEGRILETLIHLILPVRRVDKSKAEWDEDNKVRQWTGVTPLHLSLSVFFQSLSVFAVSFSFTPLISSYIFFCQLPRSFTMPTHLFSPFTDHYCAVSDVAVSSETSEKPKSRTIKENLSLRSFPKVLSCCPQIAVNIIFYCLKHFLLQGEV